MWLNGGQKVTKGKILFFPGTITVSTEVIAFCPTNLKLFIFKFSSPVFLHLPDPNIGSYYCSVLNLRTHLCLWSKLISIPLPSNTDLLYGFANLSWCSLLIFYNFSLLHSINWNRTKRIPLCKDARKLCSIYLPVEYFLLIHKSITFPKRACKHHFLPVKFPGIDRIAWDNF